MIQSPGFLGGSGFEAGQVKAPVTSVLRCCTTVKSEFSRVAKALPTALSDSRLDAIQLELRTWRPSKPETLATEQKSQDPSIQKYAFNYDRLLNTILKLRHARFSSLQIMSRPRSLCLRCWVASHPFPTPISAPWHSAMARTKLAGHGMASFFC